MLKSKVMIITSMFPLFLAGILLGGPAGAERDVPVASTPAGGSVALAPQQELKARLADCKSIVVYSLPFPVETYIPISSESAQKYGTRFNITGDSLQDLIKTIGWTSHKGKFEDKRVRFVVVGDGIVLYSISKPGVIRTPYGDYDLGRDRVKQLEDFQKKRLIW